LLSSSSYRKCHWKNKKYKRSGRTLPWETGEDQDSEVPGIVLHRFCYVNFLAPLKLAPKTLFKRLSNLLVSDYSNELRNLDYGQISKNAGQFYEIHSNEAHLIMCPAPEYVVSCHEDPLPLPPGTLAQLGRDVVLRCVLPLLSCDLDCVNFACTCKVAKKYYSHASLWRNRVSKIDYGLFDENTLMYRAFSTRNR
jgi:hypothetical protein